MGLNVIAPGIQQQIISKRSSSPLTTGTLWTFTGGIFLIFVSGIIRTAIQAQTTNTKISAKCDSLSAVDLCANTDLNAAAVGTIVHLPSTFSNPMDTHTNGVSPNAISPIFDPMICTTSGVVTVTYGAASTGVIDWYLCWQPLVPGATVS